MKDIVIKYLLEEFKPIRLISSVKNWRKLNYHNPLFSVKTDVNDYWLKALRTDQLIKMEQLAFNYAGGFNLMRSRFYQVPVVFLSNLLLDRNYIPKYGHIQNLFDIENHKYNVDDAVAIYDTHGRMPSRWIKMICDFSGHDFTIDDKSDVNMAEHREFITNKISSIKDSHMLNNILLSATGNQYYSVEVVNTPYGEWFTLDGGRCLSLPDGALSNSAKKIFHDAKSCYCLYPDIKVTDKTRYNLLFSAEGGIDMRYFKEFSYYQLINELYSKYKNTGYTDARGYSIYRSNCKDMPFEEIVILAELFKKNNFEIREQMS